VFSSGRGPVVVCSYVRVRYADGYELTLSFEGRGKEYAEARMRHERLVLQFASDKEKFLP